MKKFRYTIHNIVGHPIMEIFYLLGMRKIAMWIHDVTLPKDWEIDYENSWDAGEMDEE